MNLEGDRVFVIVFVLCVYVYTHQTDQIVLFKCALFLMLQL